MKRVIYLLAFAATVFSCNSENTQNESETQVQNVKDGKLEFEETSFDFGTIKEGEVVSHAFKFKNVGTDPVEIQAVNVSCGCTVASKPIGAVGVGQEDEIVIDFNSQGKVGQNRKTVNVLSNAQNNVIALNFTAAVEAADTESGE
ncbi:MAG: DUF1573 domain-containing protein [Cytophagales bacterium]|nr:DUF1573 domain-containing protein [Cytophagales bacterium]